MKFLCAFGVVFSLLAGCRATPEAVPTPGFSPAVETASGSAPVILDIQTRKASIETGMVAYAEVHFQDAEGDAVRLMVESAQGSPVPFQLQPEKITAPAEEQKAGAVHTIEWMCVGGGTTVALKAYLLDLAGHRSPIFQFFVTC